LKFHKDVSKLTLYWLSWWWS